MAVRHLVLAALLLAWGVSPARAHSSYSVQVLSRTGDGPVDDTPKHSRRDQPVTLYAVVRMGEVIYADAGEVWLHGKRFRARPLAELGRLELGWRKVEPAVENLSNEASGKFAYEPIPYVETEVAAWAGKTSVLADVHPTVTSDQGQGLGTMRFQVVVARGNEVVSSPGASARRGRGSGGLSDDVARVSIRGGDDYLGWLGELYGQPYIWASAGASDATHQSERLEGADCADLVVYGWRRMGHDVAYTYTGGLPRVTRLLASAAPDEQGVYRDERGQPVPFSRPGDILLFHRHVGVLVRDAGVVGVLDTQDLMLHTLFASPLQQPIVDSGYGGGGVELRRWK